MDSLTLFHNLGTGDIVDNDRGRFILIEWTGCLASMLFLVSAH